MSKQVKITLIKSMHGRKPGHMSCVRGLGLNKMHQSRVIDATPENLGMVNKVIYLLNVEDVK